MKTLDEAMDNIVVLETPDNLRRFADYVAKNAGMATEIQNNAKVQQFVLLIYERMKNDLDEIQGMGVSMEEQSMLSYRVFLTIILSALANGILLGIEMERQELPLNENA